MTDKIAGRWVVELPKHVTRKNQIAYGHWRVGWRLGKADKMMVALYCKMAKVPRAECKRRVSLHVILGPRQRFDEDCFWHSLLDSLKACGALKNDSSTWCTTGPVTHERGSTEGMVITLEDIEPPRPCPTCKGRRFVEVPTGVHASVVTRGCPECGGGA